MIDDVSGILFDRSRSIRSSANFKDSKLHIEVDLQCLAEMASDGSLASLRVVGLRLEFQAHAAPEEVTEPQLQIVPWLIRIFHSKLTEFPHLRVAEVRSPLPFLQRAAKVSPEISQLPSLGGQLLYRWGCYTENAKALQSTEYWTTGVDPITFELSGAYIYSKASIVHAILIATPQENVGVIEESQYWHSFRFSLPQLNHVLSHITGKNEDQLSHSRRIQLLCNIH